MDRSLPSQWSQFFSQLALPPEWAELYSRSFTDNSMQLEMIPDLQPDLMSYLGINKLGHFLMIKKRAKDLLSFHSPTDSPALSSSRYSVQMEEGRQGSFPQLHPPYPQSYQIRNYSLSPPLTNTPSNFVPSVTMDSESLHSFHSEGSDRCHLERYQSFHPIHSVSLPSHTPDSAHPPHSSSLPADIVPQSHSIPQTQLSDTTLASHSPPPPPPSIFTPPRAVDSLTGPDMRNITPSSDVEIDVQPYTETIFSIPNRTKPDSNKLTRKSQSRRTRPTVSTQGSVKKKKRNANRHKNPVEPLLTQLDRLESTTDSLTTHNSQSHCSMRRGANPAIVSDASAFFSPHNISSPGVLFYHSSGGRNRAITPRPVSSYKVSIPVRKDRNTGITVKSKHRKPRSRKSPVGIKSDANTLIDGDIPGIANTDDKITRTAVTLVETGAINSVCRTSGNSVNLTDATRERLSESPALLFEPILSISKLDISHYTLSARTNLAASDATLSQPEYRDTDSSIIEVDEVGGDVIPSQLDVQVVHNQFTQSRIDSPSSPSTEDVYPHSQDIDIFLTEIPGSPTVELIPSPYSTTQDVSITPADAVEDVSNTEGVQSSVISSQREDKSTVLRSGSRRKKETKNTILNVSEESNGGRMHSSVPAGTEEVEESSDLTSESTPTRIASRSKAVTAASVPDYESLRTTDDAIGDSGGEESGIATIPSHEDAAPDINSALPDSECSSVRVNHENTRSDSNQIPSVSNRVCLEMQSGGGDAIVSDANGSPQNVHPSEGERCEEAGDLLVERRRLMGHPTKKVKSKLLTSKQKLTLSTSKGDIRVRRKVSKKKIAGRLSYCGEGSASESGGRARREKIKYRGKKYGRRLQRKSMVLLRSEKKPPSLSVTNKPIRNNLFETRGRSTSPETTEDELKNTTKFQRTIPRIPKRYSDTLSAFYPGLREEESAAKPVPVHNMTYSRPQPGVRLSLRDTVVYARQERRNFACFKCASCFETPYQLLQHSMLGRCDQFDTRWPEY